MRVKARGRLQSPSTEQDADGQPLADTWTDVDTVWADILFLSGMETIKGGAETSTVKASVRIRSRSGLTSGMRFLVGSTAYNFKTVPPYMRSNPFMDIAAEVIV